MTKTRAQYASLLTLLAAVILIGLALFFVAPKSAQSSSGGTSITGYLWSDTIGWISMSGSGYGVTVDSSGNLSGYAWSDSVGWIQFGGLSGFPSGSGTSATNAQVQSNGTLTGWARVCAGMDDTQANQWQPNNTCTNGYGDRTDGWDGWISLSGSGYAPTLSSGNFSGDAWGSDVVGWIDFEYANTSYDKCLNTSGYSCTGTGNQTITYTDPSCNQSTISTCVSPNYCSAGSSVCLVPQLQYNPSTDNSGTSTFAATGHLQIIPDLLQSGETAQVYWSISNDTTCSVSGTNGDYWSGSNSGSNGMTTSPIVGQTAYTLSCTGYSGANPPSITNSVNVGISPKFQEK